MSEQTVTIRSTAESVSPRVIIPAVTVVGVLVLIIIAGAVYAIVRAHKRRQRRRGQRLSRGDEEAGGFDDSEGVWREGNWDNYVRNGRLTRDSRQMKGMVFSGRSDTIIRQPESAATRSPRPPSWDARDLVGQGFQRGSLGGANREVNTGRGYEIGHMADVYDPSDAKGGSVHVAEVSLGIHPAFRTSPPGSSKIERMTGSRLSNGMYEDRPSGSREGSNSGSSGLSYPQLNINIPSTLPDLNTDISPTTTIWSQFSPHSAGGLGGTQLAPPPATAAYPNITALAKVSGSRSSIQTTSFYIRDQSISEHVATQFAPARRESRRERSSAAYSGSSHMRRNSSTRTRKLVPPLSAAFGGFTGLTRYDSKASRASRASSISTFRHGTLEEEEENENVPPLPSPTPKQRRSWSGRSVLLLDEFPKKSAQTTATPLSGSPRIGSYLGSSIPEADGGEDLRRTTSASKVSISSMPSSVSSFNTMYAAGGLSPTPAPRLMQLSPSDRGRSPVSDTRSNKSTIDLEMETRTRNWARERAEGYEQKKARRKREDEEDDEHHQHPARSSFGFL
ncbi:hypothetical protein BZA05DRAFT_414735 [Tricharina praecox]|uniref:uncharacterized protein n=1 Tax=Tricharina praecox TaxID=43433 RepID=UPI00221EE41E|nr:uncharacterized protein BZA05DRAFT_414735 [Tricharina praecox]KAI5858992.1 hypothetical protein BZA05DRAFT_414735 [Tricharina praecox]